MTNVPLFRRVIDFVRYGCFLWNSYRAPIASGVLFWTVLDINNP